MEKSELLIRQEKETVYQSLSGVDVRSATITCGCGCGWKRSIVKMYKCLYCGVWFCEQCAEVHFGQTREEYHAKRMKEKE